MYSLYIDTHDANITICLYKNGLVKDVVIKESIQSHSIHTIPIIEEILKKEGIEAKNIKEIIIVNGPGSFTGVRIGVTIAKTFAYTLNIPIKEISALLTKAISSNKKDDKLITISDRNGYFVGIFNSNNELINPYLYLNKTEYEDYININNYEDIIIDENIEIDFQKIYNYLKMVKPIPPHGVKPLYVKKIEVQNG